MRHRKVWQAANERLNRPTQVKITGATAMTNAGDIDAQSAVAGRRFCVAPAGPACVRSRADPGGTCKAVDQYRRPDSASRFRAGAFAQQRTSAFTAVATDPVVGYPSDPLQLSTSVYIGLTGS